MVQYSTATLTGVLTQVSWNVILWHWISVPWHSEGTILNLSKHQIHPIPEGFNLMQHNLKSHILTGTPQCAWCLGLTLTVGCLAHVNSRIFSICMIDVQRHISKVICRFKSSSRRKRLAVHKPFCTCESQYHKTDHNYTCTAKLYYIEKLINT